MKVNVLLLLLLGFLLSLLPAIWRTVSWTGDAYGLVTLATYPRNEFTFNPYADNGFLVNQDGAVWILKNLDYPYSSCTDLSRDLGLCVIPLVNWVGRGLEIYPPDATARVYEILDHFIERGEPVNERYEGMAPVHEAILYRNPRYLEMLLTAGADLATTIDRPDKPFHGYDTLEFLEYLENEGISGLQEIRAIIEDRQ